VPAGGPVIGDVAVGGEGVDPDPCVWGELVDDQRWDESAAACAGVVDLVKGGGVNVGDGPGPVVWGHTFGEPSLDDRTGRVGR